MSQHLSSLRPHRLIFKRLEDADTGADIQSGSPDRLGDAQKLSAELTQKINERQTKFNESGRKARDNAIARLALDQAGKSDMKLSDLYRPENKSLLDQVNKQINIISATLGETAGKTFDQTLQPVENAAAVEAHPATVNAPDAAKVEHGPGETDDAKQLPPEMAEKGPDYGKLAQEMMSELGVENPALQAELATALEQAKLAQADFARAKELAKKPPEQWNDADKALAEKIKPVDAVLLKIGVEQAKKNILKDESLPPELKAALDKQSGTDVIAFYKQLKEVAAIREAFKKYKGESAIGQGFNWVMEKTTGKDAVDFGPVGKGYEKLLSGTPLTAEEMDKIHAKMEFLSASAKTKMYADLGVDMMSRMAPGVNIAKDGLFKPDGSLNTEAIGADGLAALSLAAMIMSGGVTEYAAMSAKGLQVTRAVLAADGVATAYGAYEGGKMAVDAYKEGDNSKAAMGLAMAIMGTLGARASAHGFSEASRQLPGRQGLEAFRQAESGIAKPGTQVATVESGTSVSKTADTVTTSERGAAQAERTTDAIFDVAAAAAKYEGELREIATAQRILKETASDSVKSKLNKIVAERRASLENQGLKPDQIDAAIAHLDSKTSATTAEKVVSSGTKAEAAAGEAVATDVAKAAPTEAASAIRWQTEKGEIFDASVTKLENGNLQINIPGKPPFFKTPEDFALDIKKGRAMAKESVTDAKPAIDAAPTKTETVAALDHGAEAAAAQFAKELEGVHILQEWVVKHTKEANEWRASLKEHGYNKEVEKQAEMSEGIAARHQEKLDTALVKLRDASGMSDTELAQAMEHLRAKNGWEKMPDLATGKPGTVEKMAEKMRTFEVNEKVNIRRTSGEIQEGRVMLVEGETTTVSFVENGKTKIKIIKTEELRDLNPDAITRKPTSSPAEQAADKIRIFAPKESVNIRRTSGEIQKGEVVLVESETATVRFVDPTDKQTKIKIVRLQELQELNPEKVAA